MIKPSTKELPVKVRRPFGNLKYRAHTVLVAVVDSQGLVILGGKGDHYPDGILRLPGGGVEPGENSQEAAQRELNEELQLNVGLERLQELFEVKVRAQDEAGKRYRLKISVLRVNLNEQEMPTPGDDLSSLARLSIGELQDLSQRFLEITPELRLRGEEGFYWSDYGKVYGPIHAWVAEALESGSQRHIW